MWLLRNIILREGLENSQTAPEEKRKMNPAEKNAFF